jgi:hypothetical protein
MRVQISKIIIKEPILKTPRLVIKKSSQNALRDYSA